MHYGSHKEISQVEEQINLSRKHVPKEDSKEVDLATCSCAAF